ncbi:MAG: 4Fe-4S binding protein [Methanomassiliicoccales archaeon]|nr:4Fe-4S binding protein [Methanomassiliicoccales archaeon]
MFRIIDKGVRRKGVVTNKHTEESVIAHEGHLGMPFLDQSKCFAHKDCARVCPSEAIEVTPVQWRIDLGRCQFCGECARICPEKAIIMTGEYQLSCKTKEGTVRTYDIRI